MNFYHTNTSPEGLSFDIQNTMGKGEVPPTIFITEVSGANQLLLSLTNHTGAPLKFTGGSLGHITSLEQLEKAKMSALLIDFSSLFHIVEPIELERIISRMSLTLAGWESKLLEGRVWVLSPKKDGTLAKDAILTVSIGNVIYNHLQTADFLNLSYFRLGDHVADGDMQLLMAVRRLSGQAARLLDAVVQVDWHDGNNSIIISESGKPVKNHLAFTLTNISGEPIMGDPGVDEAPRFELEFVSAEKNLPGILASKQKVELIKVSIPQTYGLQWEVEKPEVQSGNTRTLTPSDPQQVLGVGAERSIAIGINDIITTYAAGFALVKLHYYNLLGFDDGTLLLFIEKRHFEGHLPLTAINSDHRQSVLSWGADGASSMRLQSAYPLVIGKGEATEQLVVDGAIANTVALISNGGHGNAYAGFMHRQLGPKGLSSYALLQGNDGATYLNAAPDKSVCIRNNNQDRMVVTAGGNVGIGTNNPAQKLEVKGNVQTGQTLLSDGGYGDSYAAFQHKSLNASNKGQYALMQRDKGETYLNASNDQPIHFRINDTDQMIITKDGRVGIGSDNPSAKLAVLGDIVNSSAAICNSGYGNDWAAFKNKALGTDTQANYALLQHKNGTTILNTGASRDLHIRNNNSDRMIFKAGGNVGIGTINPVTALHLSGDLYVTGKVIAEGKYYSHSYDGVWQRTRHVVDFGYIWEIHNPWSDQQLKKDLRPIGSALAKVQQLNGVCFRWNQKGLDLHLGEENDQYLASPQATDEENQQLNAERNAELAQRLDQEQIGLVAQDVEAVFPELVEQHENGYKMVNYNRLSAVLVEALKEQQKEIDELKAQVAEMGRKQEAQGAVLEMLVRKMGC